MVYRFCGFRTPEILPNSFFFFLEKPQIFRPSLLRIIGRRRYRFSDISIVPHVPGEHRTHSREYIFCGLCTYFWGYMVSLYIPEDTDCVSKHSPGCTDVMENTVHGVKMLWKTQSMVYRCCDLSTSVMGGQILCLLQFQGCRVCKDSNRVEHPAGSCIIHTSEHLPLGPV